MGARNVHDLTLWCVYFVAFLLVCLSISIDGWFRYPSPFGASLDVLKRNRGSLHTIIWIFLLLSLVLSVLCFVIQGVVFFLDYTGKTVKAQKYLPFVTMGLAITGGILAVFVGILFLVDVHALQSLNPTVDTLSPGCSLFLVIFGGILLMVSACLHFQVNKLNAVGP
ncbi:uncharacterized protein LOC131954360 [Physella acuta]|uniref:uncharacterized protein LOC131954360 n=1 Tax=Physella acuta TaxID=109671 RepID=UPI0027DE5E31|nr:uncharacterized protein LOC131954360 [Physella acuta]